MNQKVAKSTSKTFCTTQSLNEHADLQISTILQEKSPRVGHEKSAKRYRTFLNVCAQSKVFSLLFLKTQEVKQAFCLGLPGRKAVHAGGLL